MQNPSQNKLSFSWESFRKAPIVGIVRGLSENIVHQIAQAYQEAGLYALEITMNTEGVSKMIKELSEEFPNLCIGAGTVCSLADLDQALKADAQFIVTPVINEEVITHTVAQGIPIFPGAYTPSEIYKAWSLGASAVKVFPATQLGVKYIKDVLAPLNEVKLVPTGGVSLENIKAFLEAGAVGVGMGSSLLDKTLIQAEDFEGLKNHFLRIKAET